MQDVASARGQHAEDEAWLRQADEFATRAEAVRMQAMEYVIGGEFDSTAARNMQKAAPAPFDKRPSWEFDFVLIAQGVVRRVAAHIPMYKATVVALFALIMLVVPPWHTPAASLVIFAQTFVIGYQVIMFFATN